MSDEDQLIVLDSNGTTMDMRIHSYNLKLNRWNVKKLPSLLDDRSSFGLTLLNREMFFAGGQIYSRGGIKEVFCLNLHKMEFLENEPMTLARLYFGLVQLNDELYAIGGLVNDEWSSSVEKYNFSIDKWTPVGCLRSSMRYVTAATLDGFIYATDQYSYSMECYDSVSNEWSIKATPKSKLQNVNLIGFDGFLYAICYGYCNSVHRISMERYDPSRNKWEERRAPRYGTKCAVVHKRLLACGQIDWKNKECVVEEYHPQTDEWSTLTNVTVVNDVHSVFNL